MSERIPASELTSEELELAATLKERGPEDPEAMAQLAHWTIRQEEWANEQNTSRANIEVNLRRARLYLVAGFHREAWDTLNEVRAQAHNEGEQNLLAAAEELMTKIEFEGAD